MPPGQAALFPPMGTICMHSLPAALSGATATSFVQSPLSVQISLSDCGSLVRDGISVLAMIARRRKRSAPTTTIASALPARM